VSTATATTLLAARGLRRATIAGARPIVPGTRLADEAFTLRCIPAREDLDWSGAYDNLSDRQRLAIELVGPGQVLVMDARGDTSSGGIGAILSTRLKVRGVAGPVTDGVVRDDAEIGETGLATFCRGAHPGASRVVFDPADFGRTIGCGGVAAFPGDVVVGDDDGVVVIPRHLAEEVAEEGVEMERRERCITERIRAGAPLAGTYPLEDAGLAAYATWRGSNPA
jgi:regulator of RNase E activity RraA